MTTLLALLPLLLVMGLLASGRVGSLVAGLAGLSATLLASFVIVLESRGPAVLGSLFLRETAAGAWLSWHVIAIIAGGMFFHRCLQAHDGAKGGDGRTADPRRLWSICFLVAPFAEAVTGFGVGYIIALAALGRAGIGGLPALIERTRANFDAVARFVENRDWVDFLAGDPATRSPTSICLAITAPWFVALPEAAQRAAVKRMTGLLEAESVAYDIGGYRDAPPGLRLWGGATVERSDLEALGPWLDWAYARIAEDGEGKGR